MDVRRAQHQSHNDVLAVQSATLESVSSFRRAKSVAGLFNAVHHLLDDMPVFRQCRAVLWVVDFAKEQMWSYTSRAMANSSTRAGAGGGAAAVAAAASTLRPVIGTPDHTSFAFSTTHASPLSPATAPSFAPSPVHPATGSVRMHHPVDTSLGTHTGQHTYVKIKFPLGASLAGACAVAGEPAMYTSAVTDPRYEPAGDVAVKLAMQMHAVRARSRTVSHLVRFLFVAQ